MLIHIYRGTNANLWNWPRCPSIDEYIKNTWYRYTIDFYSAIKKNEILSFSGKCMEIETIILSEISQTEKVNGYMSP